MEEEKKGGRRPVIIVVLGVAGLFAVVCACVMGLIALQGDGEGTASPVGAATSTVPSSVEAATTVPAELPTETSPAPSATVEPTETPEPTDTLEPTDTSTPINTPTPSNTPTASNTPTPTNTPGPTNTPLPTNTPKPTNTPTPTHTSTPAPTPIVIQGAGQYVTNPISLPAPVSIARFKHQGQSNFIVKVYVGGNLDDILVNEIGTYNGSRPLNGDEPVVLEIDADGAWSVKLRPIGWRDAAPAEGKGDKATDLFTPPASGPWEVGHNGTSNFIVWLHCAGGSDVIRNEIGAVSGSTMVSFPKGPCFWEIQADGEWFLRPRE